METINNNFLCNICNKQYKNKSGIWKHNNKYHVNKDNINKSDISQISAVNKSDISQISAVNIHMKTCTQNVLNKGKYKCKYCSKIFTPLKI
jgi:hypothetical protein